MSDLQERLDRAERALTRSGFTLIEGAQEWKPPLGPSASPLLDRIDLLTFLLRELRDGVEGEWCFPGNLDERIDAALAGKLPERRDTEWTDAASAPTAEDYRELQAQHDQLQSRLKAALDVVRELVELPYSTGGLIDRLRVRERARDLLAGQASDHAEQPLAIVPKGWQLVPVEPAFAMLAADGCKEHHEGQECTFHKNRRRIWAAMLAAAPKPEGAA